MHPKVFNYEHSKHDHLYSCLMHVHTHAHTHTPTHHHGDSPEVTKHSEDAIHICNRQSEQLLLLCFQKFINAMLWGFILTEHIKSTYIYSFYPWIVIVMIIMIFSALPIRLRQHFVKVLSQLIHAWCHEKDSLHSSRGRSWRQMVMGPRGSQPWPLIHQDLDLRAHVFDPCRPKNVLCLLHLPIASSSPV